MPGTRRLHPTDLVQHCAQAPCAASFGKVLQALGFVHLHKGLDAGYPAPLLRDAISL